MRFLNGLAFAGLAGLATAAASPPAQVYILSSTGPTPSPKREAQIPRQVARHIFLQRLSGQTRLGDDDLPASLGDDEALSYIAQYGKAPRPLFGDDAASSSPGTLEPSQLLVLIEDALDDIAAKKIPGFMAAQGFLPAFTIPDAPPAQANEHLVGTELAQFAGSCSLEAAANPYDDCWGGKMSLAVRYESTKYANSLNDFIQDIRGAVAHGVLEATIVYLPQSTRQSKNAYWTTDAPSELRRRLVEAPITDVVSKVAVAPGSGGAVVGGEAADPSSKINLGCFTSFNSCVATTGNCTGHGMCVDKYAVPGQGSGDKQCFVCSCLSTLTHPDDKDKNGRTHWGGAYCQKIDVSSPFWLLFGTSFILVGLVTGCIVMLFSVGEEKLPGVIGAGVSRSK